MAHFAELDANNKVIRVVVVHNSELLDENGQESEAKGIEFCRNHFSGTWVQTSYNHSFRKNYACVGQTYDRIRDAFIPPRPHPSWILDEATCRWIPPVAKPQDGKEYVWASAELKWIEVTANE